MPFGLSPCLGNGCVMTLGQVRSGQDGTIQVQLISLPLVSVPLPGRVTHSFLAHFSLSAVSNLSHILISIVAKGKEGH